MTNQKLLSAILKLMLEHNAKRLELTAEVDGHDIAVELELTRMKKLKTKKHKGTH